MLHSKHTNGTYALTALEVCRLLKYLTFSSDITFVSCFETFFANENVSNLSMKIKLVNKV